MIWSSQYSTASIHFLYNVLLMIQSSKHSDRKDQKHSRRSSILQCMSPYTFLMTIIIPWLCIKVFQSVAIVTLQWEWEMPYRWHFYDGIISVMLMHNQYILVIHQFLYGFKYLRPAILAFYNDCNDQAWVDNDQIQLCWQPSIYVSQCLKRRRVIHIPSQTRYWLQKVQHK